MSEEVTLPSQFTHSIKLEETAKGIRMSIHVYASDRATAMKEAALTYRSMKQVLENDKYVLAPMEISK